MIRRVIVLLSLLGILTLGACDREPESAAHPRVRSDLEPGVDLPRVGTVGIHPSRESRLVINVDRTGRLVVHGNEATLDALPAIIEGHADADREEQEPRASRRYVVLRLDETLPWEVAKRLLAMCAEPAIGVHRVHFAVRPELGDEEGSLATHLGREREDGVTRCFQPVPVTACVTEQGPGSDPAALYPRVKALLKEDPSLVCRVDAAPFVPVGYVLRTIDVFHRAGARAVSCVGTLPPDSSRDLPAILREAAERTVRPTLRLLDETLGLEAPPLPATSRARGGFAGTTRPRPLGAVNVVLDDLASLHASPPPIEEIPAIVDPDGEVVLTDLPLESHEPPADGRPALAPLEDPQPVALLTGNGRGGRLAARAPSRESISSGSQPNGSIERALDWLAQHQAADGRWDCDGFESRCKLNKCGGTGNPVHDVGCTGLALLAFLESGHTHRSGSHREVVRRGLRYLRSVQNEEGRFGTSPSSKFVYDHAIATFAIARAFAITGSPLFRRPTQRAVDFIEACRNPYLGWRYGKRPGDNDTSVTTWMLLALDAARRSKGIRVPLEAFDGARAWLDKVTEPEYGRVGYTARGTGPGRPADLLDLFPADRSESLTALGMVVRMRLGEDPAKSEMIRKGARLLLKQLPRWDRAAGTIDMIYWYFGTLAMSRVGGEGWTAWHVSLKSAITDRQRHDGDQRGSWDPVGVRGRVGGRIYSTSLMALTLLQADSVRPRD